MALNIKPFSALLPTQKHAARIVCPPYDVVDTEQARQLAAGNPYSLLHITRPEIGLPQGSDPYSDGVYLKAAGNLRHFQKQGWLVEDRPSLYIYRILADQQGGEHVQTGVVGLVSAKDYEAGLIKRHEKTRPEKENDRTRLACQINAHLEPVFLVYRQQAGLTALIAAETKADPLYQVEDQDGAKHLLWRAKNQAGLLKELKNLPALYIADGHHRSAAARRTYETKCQENANHSGLEGYNFSPAVIFPAAEVKVFQYDWEGDPKKRPLSEHSIEKIMELSDAGGILPPRAPGLPLN